MWPFSASNILDQSVMQAMPQQQLGFGALTGQQTPQSDPQQAQSQPNRTLNNPALLNALGRMGSAILIANSKGAGFDGSFGYGLDAFNDEQNRQHDQGMADQLTQAKIAKAQQEAQYGVQSQGFEGDLARAQVVLADPNSSAHDKAVAQGVVATAQRLQGSWDPVSGQYAWNPKSRLVGQGASPPPAAQALSNSLPTPTMSQSAANQQNGDLMPPPAVGQTPDASLFQSTGNRKVDAALQQQAAEVPLAGRKTVAEGVASADTATFGALADQTRKLAAIEPQVQQIKALAANTKTGGLGVARMKFGQLFGVDLDGVPEAQQITAITSALAPAMRAPGSGSSSDRDVNMFLAALPSLWNTPGGIDRIADSYSKLLDRRKEEEKIARRMLKDQGSLDGFYDETAKLKPLFDEKFFGSVVSNPGAQQTGTAQAKTWKFNPTTGRLE
ncbi:MAG: hypothetical protein J0I79_16455 [Mesorhizobium sp.]|uniref:hypothetical protein n=1 Tax=Mesorhizobium sp. TaxID=1871066 RepID=UPI001ACE5A57|nr:hypothetical protein [Mesorhizobium sp.]MBN9219538.1 hypothetical protein [Mesorhizobium sp.]